MTRQTKAVLNAALALPERERAQLVEQILETLAEEPEILSDKDFIAELRRRAKEMDQGTTHMVPWSEVKKKMRP